MTTTHDPNDLLKQVNRSILLPALAVSLGVHVVLIFGTSLSLYRDWCRYGVHAPAAIKALKQAEAREAEAADRRTETQKKTGPEAASQGGASNALASASIPGAAEPSAPPSSPASSPEAPQVPEIEPLPPKTSFSLGDDLRLE